MNQARNSLGRGDQGGGDEAIHEAEHRPGRAGRGDATARTRAAAKMIPNLKVMKHRLRFEFDALV